MTHVGLGIVVLSGAIVAANGATQARRTSTEYVCAADLGAGVGNPTRRFCDVVITTAADGSVTVPIPPHTGTATLVFDLHNRFTVAEAPTAPGQAFARHTAIVALLGPGGRVLDRAGVRREFRTVEDLFDRITGGTAAGGVKLVAPGQPQAVRAVIPTGIASVAIVGERVEILNSAGAVVYDSPERPVALVSNVRVDYRTK